MNAIELAVFASRIESICEEMGALLQRAAFSPNIKDRLDYSCAIFDCRGGLVAQAAHIPVHLGSMAFAMEDVVDLFQWSSGDVVVFNDPYLGGTHLPDVTLVSPVFVGDQLVAFVANRAHHANIGADSPGSMPVSTHLDQEGVLISPVKLFVAGEINRVALKILLSIDKSASNGTDLDRAADALENTMVSANENGIPLVLGDFFAQIASVSAGCERLSALVEQMKAPVFFTSIEQLNDYGRRMTMSALAQIPAGEYAFQDYLDDDGVSDAPILLQVKVFNHAGGIRFDFDGTADQVSGNVNCPLSVTAAAVYYVVRCLLPPQVPACAGMFEPIEILAKKGAVLNATFPAAVAAGNVETSSRVVDLVLGALVLVLPGAVSAASQGTMNNVAMGGESSRFGYWDYYETLCGGHGAHAEAGGLSARHSHMTNTLNTPVESLESHYPLRIERYALRSGSGGKGLYAGGEGVVRHYRFLESASLTLLTERRQIAPWGVLGGAPAEKGINRINGRVVSGKYTGTVAAGDLLSVDTPGGGGYGKEIPD